MPSVDEEDDDDEQHSPSFATNQLGGTKVQHLL
jgi:hypothetical protein